MSIRTNFFKICLLVISAGVVSNVNAAQELKVYLETNEFFAIKDNIVTTKSAFISGNIKYSIGKFGLRKSGDSELTNSEDSNGMRDLEIISDTELKITLRGEIGHQIIVPAVFDKNEDGQVTAITVRAEDYLASLNPIQEEMDSKIFQMAKSKILGMLPFDIKLLASDLTCQISSVVSDEEELLENELQCTQTHFIDLSK